MKITIRTKVSLLVSIAVIIGLVFTSVAYIRVLGQNFHHAIKRQSEMLAQSLLYDIETMRDSGVEFTPDNIAELWSPFSRQCQELYTWNKDKDVTHIAILDASGTILVHNNEELRNTTISSSIVLDSLKTYKTLTVLDTQENIFHTLIPIFTDENTYLAAIDVGFPGDVLDEAYSAFIFKAFWLLCVFLVLSFSVILFLVNMTVTRPIRYLVQIGERLSQGNLIHRIDLTSQNDEVASLANVFVKISNYLREITGIAEDVSTGALKHQVQKRSKRDTLGIALQEMLSYLQEVAGIASRISEGDLTVTPPLRSDTDAFGRSMRAMIRGLQSLVQQIRDNTEEISGIGAKIAAFADMDTNIVQTAQKSVERMVETMTEMGSSVEEVANNMDMLSTSVEETSASVSVMTASITNIASNTTDLAEQTQHTISELNNSTSTLDNITDKTEIARQLSQESRQDALQGQNAVEEVTASMDTIQQTNSSTVETITRFEKQTQDIGMILDMIGEITDQSSLLALNASIIAAQAGSHGRGFAVIADEMRNLANKVNESTKDIAAIVKTVQEETAALVKKIHKTTTDIDQGVQRTQYAQQMLLKISTSAERSSSVVEEIADAVQQMQQTIGHQMKLAMEQVHTMTSEITRATSEQKTSTIQINEAVEHITHMASQTQQATAQQLEGVRQILDTAERVKNLTDQNLASSEQIDRTAANLAARAQKLLHAVDRFKLTTTESATPKEVTSEVVEETSPALIEENQSKETAVIREADLWEDDE